MIDDGFSGLHWVPLFLLASVELLKDHKCVCSAHTTAEWQTLHQPALTAAFSLQFFFFLLLIASHSQSATLFAVLLMNQLHFLHLYWRKSCLSVWDCCIFFLILQLFITAHWADWVRERERRCGLHFSTLLALLLLLPPSSPFTPDLNSFPFSSSSPPLSSSRSEFCAPFVSSSILRWY